MQLARLAFAAPPSQVERMADQQALAVPTLPLARRTFAAVAAHWWVTFPLVAVGFLGP